MTELFTERFVTRVTLTTARQLRALAAKERRSVANVLRVLLERALALNVSAAEGPRAEKKRRRRS